MKAKVKCLEKKHKLNRINNIKSSKSFENEKKKTVCVRLYFASNATFGGGAARSRARLRAGVVHQHLWGGAADEATACRRWVGAQCLYLFTRYKKMGKLRKTNDKPKETNKQPIARQTDRIDAKHWGSYAIPRWEKRQRKKN